MTKLEEAIWRTKCHQARKTYQPQGTTANTGLIIATLEYRVKELEELLELSIDTLCDAGGCRRTIERLRLGLAREAEPFDATQFYSALASLADSAEDRTVDRGSFTENTD